MSSGTGFRNVCHVLWTNLWSHERVRRGVNLHRTGALPREESRQTGDGDGIPEDRSTGHEHIGVMSNEIVEP
jgi:hypothetical protein